MNRIKDFFYKQNDIIVVIIILAVAGLLIYNRIGAIMEYPAKIAQQQATTTEEEQTPQGETN